MKTTSFGCWRSIFLFISLLAAANVARAQYAGVSVLNSWTETEQNCWWEGGDYWYSYYDDEGQEIVVLTPYKEVCDDPVYYSYATVEVYAYGLNPDCTYSIETDTDAQSGVVSGQSSYSSVETYDLDWDWPPSYAWIDEDCPEPECQVTGVQAKDSAHPSRVAGDGGTLYLVGENSADISATDFGPGCEWANGQTSSSFTDSSSSDETYSVGSLSVMVVRMQAASVTVTTPSFMKGSSDTINLAGKVPYVGTSLKLKFNAGNTSFSGSKCEKYNNPDWGVKVMYNLGVGAEADARVTYPPLTWYVPPGSSDPWLGAEVAVGLKGTAAITGSGGYDPSKSSPYDGSVSMGGSVELYAEAFAYANIPFFDAEATGRVGTGVGLTGRLQGSNIEARFNWSGIVFIGHVKIYSDPSDPWVNTSINYNICDGDSTDWVPVYEIPTS